MASNIFNQKAVECEETVRYWLFPADGQGEAVADAGQLEDLAASMLALVAPHTHTYIWNNQPFNLNVCMGQPCDGTTGVLGPHLYGSSAVGDLLDDEWFIVFLLQTITKHFPGLVCRVTDSDGEFLLVEAADHLPAWVNPDTAEQRVYIFQGQVHLIPLTSTPGTLSPLPRGTPKVMDAQAAIRRLPDATRASPSVQNAINAKTDGYPGRISREQHVGHVYVPVGVAALLREYPTLVAPAVHAFCRRDAMDNKVLRMMRHFPPETRVLTAVRFSKALYAQVASTRYTPDLRTGWNIPAPSAPHHKSHDIGMKLACGFELLVCSAGGVTPGSTPASTPTDQANPDLASHLELNNNPRWLKYRQSLADKGYFRGELEGSKLHKELEQRARQFFASNLLTGRGGEGEDALSAGATIVRLLAKVNVDYEFFKERSTRLVPEDDDSWLQITPDALDNLLETKFGNGAPKAADETEMMNSLSAFLGHMSDLEGAEVPQDLQDRLRKLSTMSRKTSKARKVSGLGVNPQIRKISSQSNASDASNSSEMSSLSNKVDFNAESFTEAMNNILEIGVPEDDYWNQSEDDSSGMSSYGEDDQGDGSLSRKSSNTSQKSAASSGVDLQMKEYMREMERELAATNLRDDLATTSVRDAALMDDDDEADDEFDDVEDFEPVKVDLQAVRDLVKTYTAQNGVPGPASTLLASVASKTAK